MGTEKRKRERGNIEIVRERWGKECEGWGGDSECWEGRGGDRRGGEQS